MTIAVDLRRKATNHRNELNKFNNTGARMLDSIYHMMLYYFEEITFLALKCYDFCHYVCNVVIDVIT